MDDTKLLLWQFLLTKGRHIIKESYYGDEVNMDYCGNDFDVMDHLANVNWNKTKEPETNSDCRFVGTFQDADDITVYKGTLHFINGKEELWKMEVNECLDFGELVSMIVEFLKED